MKFLFLLLQEIMVFASNPNQCELKCNWKVFNWDESIATVTSSGQSSGNLVVMKAFDGDNEMGSNSAYRLSLNLRLKLSLQLIADVLIFY